MKYRFLTYFLPALFLFFSPPPAAAQIKDAADKVLKTLEEAAAKASEAYKQVSALQDEVNQAKTGILGTNAWPFSKLKENFITSKITTPFTTASYAQGDENALAEAIGDAMLPEYGQGGDTKLSQQQNLNNLLTQQNNAAGLYSRALAMRASLAEEYERKPPELDLKDGMAVLRAAQAYAERINLRLIDIANLDAAASDLDNSRDLMSQNYYNMLARYEAGDVDTSGDSL